MDRHATARSRDGYRVAFRGYHALTAAQATAQAKASQAVKTRGTHALDSEQFGARRGGTGGRLMADQISEGRHAIVTRGRFKGTYLLSLADDECADIPYGWAGGPAATELLRLRLESPTDEVLGISRPDSVYRDQDA